MLFRSSQQTPQIINHYLVVVLVIQVIELVVIPPPLAIRLMASRTNPSPVRTGYTGYLLGDGIPPNGEAFGHGIQFPDSVVTGDYFLRTDFLPNRLFRFDGTRWNKLEDAVRMTMTNNDTRQTLKTSFINNTTVNTIGGEEIPERQAPSKALKPKADNQWIIFTTVRYDDTSHNLCV